MKRFFYPEIGSTIRVKGSMKKGKLIEVHNGRHFYVRFKRHCKWLTSEEVGCELPDWLSGIRPLVDEEESFIMWFSRRSATTRRITSFVLLSVVVVLFAVIIKIINL